MEQALTKQQRDEIAAKRKRQAVFLEALAGKPGSPPQSIARSCRAAGISRSTFKAWRADDQEFADLFEDAFEAGSDELEDVATDRAVHGVTHDVYGRDKDGDPMVVGQKTVYSDTLMQFILTGRRPARYRQGTDINVMNVNAVSGPADDAQLARALALLVEQAKRKQLNGSKA